MPPSCTGRRCLAALLLVGLALRGAAASDLPVAGALAAVARQDARPVAIRVQWGGGKPRAWTGSIAVTAAGAASVSEWRTLCTEPDAAALLHGSGSEIAIHEPRPIVTDGVELSIAEWRTARLRVRLAAATGGQPETDIDVAVADVLAAAVQQQLDGDGNRLTIRQATGDPLRVVIADPRAAMGCAAVRRPGERVRFRVDPLLPVRADQASRFELRVRLLAGPRGEAHDAQAVPIVPRDAATDAAGDRRLTRFEPVEFEIALPDREGGCDVDLQVVEVGSLRWARTLASRTVQLVVVRDAPHARATGDWKLVHEVDPGSPRLHERLRRLPGTGLSMPAIPLPAVPLPAFPRPNVSLPNVQLPNVQLPNVPLPNVPLPKMPSVGLPPMASMVPRFSGLLVVGHSTVEPHALGPMLLLPPAKADGEPAWEGIVLAGAQPGVPHAVEIEYPSDQDAVVGAAVLELDATAASVEVRHSGGFEVRRDAYRPESELRRHRFVFWPTTRHPLIVVSNPSTRRSATVGKVRILVGPDRLPAAEVAAVAGPRRTFALLPTPDFTAWGGVERVDAATGRAAADWDTHLAAVRHSAEWLASRAAAGGLVTVYAQGAAAWPSSLTRHAPRWGSGAAADTGLDPQPKDVLDLLCRVYAAAGLKLVPGMAFDGPLPELEAALAAEGAATGLACVGRDGRPLRTRHGVHYNVLDLRVQQAVERQVRELAARVRGCGAVEGVAVLLSHEGWLHLPGTAAALDDSTFARFLASVGVQEPEAGPERFARRAEMVEGRLRDLWLEWRADVVAAFHARLAAAVVEHDPRLALHLVPTTLFAAGDLAARFRPRLGAESPMVDAMREVGLDPLRSTAHPQVVFASPHVHTAADGLVDAGSVAAANLAPTLAEAARAARRRSIAIVEQPVACDIKPIVAHGPFGSATPAGGCEVHAAATGAATARPLAEALVAADAEVVFDMRLACGESAGPSPAFAALPGGTLETVADLPLPVVIRLQRAAGTTWMRVVNAAAAPGLIRIGLEGRPLAVSDAVDRARLELAADGVASVPMAAWGVRTLVVEGDVTVRSARIDYDVTVQAAVASRVQDLRRRRAALEMPAPLEVLDNPGFDVGPEDADAFTDRAGGRPTAVTGWELVEQRRGTLDLVAGRPASTGGTSRGLAFASANGLASLHSNPFAPPATGRVSVGCWLRLQDGGGQPPLRIAVEGVHEDREYYRFAAVGGLAGGRPLTGEWAQFVLPVDDLPTAGLESLRVRFDLLGPGVVLIDDVGVYDLAFEESQRVQLSRMIDRFEQALATRDVGGCVVGLDGHWPRFLAEFVSDAAVARMAAVPAPAGPGAPPPEKPAAPGTIRDRVKGWWR